MLGEGGFGQVWKFEADNIDGNKGNASMLVYDSMLIMTFQCYWFNQINYKANKFLL